MELWHCLTRGEVTIRLVRSNRQSVDPSLPCDIHRLI